jgi:hypothetical protein
MQYRLRDKRKRNEEIRKFHKDNPDITEQEIGVMYSISHQRVSVILSKKDKQ